MKSDDRRSGRIALVADGVMNPGDNQSDLMAPLVERGWGVIALPPERLGRASIAQWMAGVADQAAEFQRHGMTVVAVLDSEETHVCAELERACAATGAQNVPTHVLSQTEQGGLVGFLERRAAKEPTP